MIPLGGKPFVKNIIIVTNTGPNAHEIYAGISWALESVLVNRVTIILFITCVLHEVFAHLALNRICYTPIY